MRDRDQSKDDKKKEKQPVNGTQELMKKTDREGTKEPVKKSMANSRRTKLLPKQALGKHVPRAAFVEFESAVLGEVHTATRRPLFQPEQQDDEVRALRGREDSIGRQRA